MVDTFIPLQSSLQSTYPRRFSKELIAVIKSKKLIHRSVKRCNAYSDYLVFFKLRTDSKALSAKCRTFYINSIEKLIPRNFKSFWSRENNCTFKKSRTFEHLWHSSPSCLVLSIGTQASWCSCLWYLLYKNTFHLFELRIEVGDAFGIISNSVINDRSDDDGLFSRIFRVLPLYHVQDSMDYLRSSSLLYLLSYYHANPTTLIKIRSQYLRFIFYKIYKPILKIAISKQRRLISDLSFISKILNDHVDCPDISNLVQF